MALPAVSIICESSPTKPPFSFPLTNVDGVGLRRAISDEEVERLFGLLGDGKIDNHQNWKGRFKDNSDKMRSGSIYDVADVLKSLTFLAKSKSLSFREKRMLDRAKFLIISEVSEVMRETAPDIEARVDQRARALLLDQGQDDRTQGGHGNSHGNEGPGAARPGLREPAPRCARVSSADAPNDLTERRTAEPGIDPARRASAVRRVFSFMMPFR